MGGKYDFILVPNQGEDIQINAWNWRATLELLFAASPDTKSDDIDENELYSATYEWLETFAHFCQTSKGFEVR